MRRNLNVLQFFSLIAGPRDRHGGSLHNLCQGRFVERRTVNGWVRKSAKALVSTLTLLLVLVPGVASPQWVQVGQDIEGQDAMPIDPKWFGYSVALSADGSRVAIGAPKSEWVEPQEGLVRILDWDSVAGAWVQLGSQFEGWGWTSLGASVALSADGFRVAIGAPGAAGHRVWVFDWIDPAWVEVAPGPIYGESGGDGSGRSVALSADGSQVAIGAPWNEGNGSLSGHVRVHQRLSSEWVQRGSDIDGEAAGDESGWAVALSADGSRVAVGAPKNDAVGGPFGDYGHVRVYQYHGFPYRDWLQVGQDIDGEAQLDNSGTSVALSADGSYVAIGAPHNGGKGHVRVYFWLSPNWVQIGQDINGEAAGDEFGKSVALSADGSRVAIGAPKNDVNGGDSGHVRIYQYRGFPIDNWIHVGQDINGEAAGDESGWSVALSSGGTRVAIGAPLNSDNGFESGHVRVYSTEIFVDGFESGDTSAW